MSTATAAPAVTTLAQGVDARTQSTFATKHPDHTAWIEIEYPVEAIPQGLIDDLAGIGFAESTQYARLPAMVAWDRATGQDLDYRSQEVTLGGPRGSGLFGAWTDAEKRTHMAAARKVFRKHGITRVPVWRKTWRDLI
jgi:hypothetical protein